MPSVTVSFELTEDQPEDPSSPSEGLLWSHDFEDGKYGSPNLEFSASSGTSHDIIPDPTGRSSRVLELHNPSGGGNRARMEKKIYADDPNNLPPDGIYRGWFNLADNQKSNNIFQFKQSIKFCVRPKGGSCTSQTRDVIHWMRVNHQSSGRHDIHMRRTSLLDGNRWTANGTAPSNGTHAQLDNAVQAGRWHFLEVRFKWSSKDFGVGPGDGVFAAWIDGQLIGEKTFVTQFPLVQSGKLPAHLDSWPQPGQNTYTHEARQATWNNYMIGSGNSGDTKILWDDLSVHALS